MTGPNPRPIFRASFSFIFVRAIAVGSFDLDLALVILAVTGCPAFRTLLPLALSLNLAPDNGELAVACTRATSSRACSLVIHSARCACGCACVGGGTSVACELITAVVSWVWVGGTGLGAGLGRVGRGRPWL